MPQNDDDVTILLEFSMSPLTQGESVSEYVSRSLEIIDQSGLPYRLNPMGTVIEGPWEDVMGVVKACLDRMRTDCDRISTIVKIDYRKGKTGRLSSKVESVFIKNLERRFQLDSSTAPLTTHPSSSMAFEMSERDVFSGSKANWAVFSERLTKMSETSSNPSRVRVTDPTQ